LGFDSVNLGIRELNRSGSVQWSRWV